MNETLNAEKPPGSAAAICSPVNVALSIRQPWAWLIINAGKNIENRSWPTKFRGRVLIHAGKTMTRADYEAAVIFCSGIAWDDWDFPKDFAFPTFDSLKSQLGGIVGEVEIVGCVNGNDEASRSPWFCGEWGFMLRNAKPLPFRVCKGALGFFNPGNDLHERTADVTPPAKAD